MDRSKIVNLATKSVFLASCEQCLNEAAGVNSYIWEEYEKMLTQKLKRILKYNVMALILNQWLHDYIYWIWNCLQKFK